MTGRPEAGPCPSRGKGPTLSPQNDDARRVLTGQERATLERSARWLVGQNDSRYPGQRPAVEVVTLGSLQRVYREVDVARAAATVGEAAAALALRSGLSRKWDEMPFEAQAWWERRARLARDPKGFAGRRPAVVVPAPEQMSLRLGA